MTKLRLATPALFICDVQEKFRPVIWEYAKIIATAQKMIKASQILNIPIYATTQNRVALGPICAELGLEGDAQSQVAAHIDKSAFSMWVPEIESALSAGPHEVAVVGIESHICVTQTTLDLLAQGHRVYILADGVSSCNREEVPIALQRLALAGAVVTTSESFLYECMGDASIDEFRRIAGLVKESKSSTAEILQTLCKF